ncbi:MAG TPA: ABC transporter ATP-binding protein [Candidatus Dormibacteraeota bacterium]|jgi:NitT/TauT family transport system ATP-binding protein|nr:ABC transporter ATP-binding protein [Candidatus Dormibacteraeota bacterium]
MRVEIEALSLRFRNGVEVLRDVDLSVGAGEFVALLGPSGCGKSTLLNAIADLLDPALVETRGAIRLGGDRHELGYVFQRDALLPWRRVRDNVELGLQIRGVAARERRRRADELLALVGLSGFEAYYPHQLSGGMRQRVALARTLAYDPQLTLMDEPFGALDAQNRLILQAELLRIWERTSTTVLFVTHDLAEAILLAQRVVVLSRRPGTVKRVYEIPLPHPRDPFELRGSAEFTRLEGTIWSTLRDEFRDGARQ